MRASEFLLEYNRQKTAQMMGNQLVNAFISGPDRQQYHFYDTTFQTPDGKPNVQVILDHLLKNFEEADPTPNKIYVPWIAREYAKGNFTRLEDVHAWMPSILSDYEKFKKRSDFNRDAKDIMRLSWPELFNIMGVYEPQVQLTDKGQAREVYRDSDVRIIIPENQAAACYYGQGTRWCTAATKGQNYFDQYNSQSPLYILLPTKPQWNGEKYQLHFGSGQFMNEDDDPVSLDELIVHRFNLLPFFMKVEPEIKNFVIFAPDELLEKIGQQIREYALNYANELISEWEINDDGFREWQYETALQKKIINPETMDYDEMWDIIHNDNNINNYYEYNPEVQEYYNKVKSAVTMSSETMKSLASQMSTDGYDDSYHLVPYQKLDEVYKYSLEGEFIDDRRGRGQNLDHGLGEWLYRNLVISKTGDVTIRKNK